MLEEYFKDVKHRMEVSVEHTRQELVHIRSGRATPVLLDSIKVSYYGTSTPLKSLANVTASEARLLTVQPYDKTILYDIEREIQAANLGLNPSNDGNIIRIPIPPLTEERRQELVRYVHQLVEDGRIAVRNVRKDVNIQFREMQRNHEISEDEEHYGYDEIQKITDKYIEELNQLLEKKEKELMEE